MLIPTLTFLAKTDLDARSDTAWLGNASVGLIAAPFNPTPTSTQADFTEANYSGYARKAAGMSTITFNDPKGLVTIEGLALQFLPSDTVTANTIYGLFMTGSPSTTLLGVEMFDSPISLTGPSTQITIIPRFGLDPAAAFGYSVVAP